MSPTLIVNSTGDDPDDIPGNGYCLTSSGMCTLRAAIMEANNYSGANTIVFNIPGDDPGFNGYWWTIELAGNLPDITGGNLQILGSSQTTNQWDSNTGTVGTGGTVGLAGEPLPEYERPEVAIDGNYFTPFSINGNISNVTVEGLALYNTWDGVSIYPGFGTGRTIHDMLIGVMPDGTDPGAERSIGHGIVINGSSATITSNFIGWNGEDGIRGEANTILTVTYNEVFSNGEDLDSGLDTYDGIDLNGNSGVVRYNLIRDNLNASLAVLHTSGAGIELGPQTPGTGGTLIEENTITGNLNAGISIRNGSTSNYVRHNIITGNYVGISVYAESSGQTNMNTFTENQFSSNEGLGIDLHVGQTGDEFDGVTPNDDGDTDDGPNGLMNFPVIYSAVISGSDLIITGEARPGATIEFFRTDSDSSGYGEGEVFIGSADEGGVEDGDTGPGLIDTSAEAFSFILPVGDTQIGDSLTATAKDKDLGHTSEFAENVIVE
jgi:CSLREA domain-containing protein